jgi:hypothetical protein
MELEELLSNSDLQKLVPRLRANRFDLSILKEVVKNDD